MVKTIVAPAASIYAMVKVKPPLNSLGDKFAIYTVY
jgi:hypothetical protein